MSHVAAGLDFDGHKLAVFLQQKINFAPSAISPEVEFAVKRIQRPPCSEGLEQSLFQPKPRIRTAHGLGGGSDSSQ